MKKLLLLSLLLLAFMQTLQAHPVIWKDGKALLYKNDNGLSETQMLYSVTQRWALGLRQLNFDDSDTTWTSIQSNALLKRWNQSGSQANLYGLAGLLIESESDESLKTTLALQADWESRRYYSYARVDYFPADESTLLLVARLGFAPYIADFDGYHSWLMLQYSNHIEGGSNSSTVMPVVRVFKDNILLEYGSDFSTAHFVAAMFHF